jgi:hypothetical protein
MHHFFFSPQTSDNKVERNLLQQQHYLAAVDSKKVRQELSVSDSED